MFLQIEYQPNIHQRWWYDKWVRIAIFTEIRHLVEELITPSCLFLDFKYFAIWQLHSIKASQYQLECNERWLVYKYWLLMRGMVENYCPKVKLNLGLLFTKARRAEVNSRPRLSFTEGTIIFYHSPNKRAVSFCFIHPIHRFFSPYQTVKSSK